MNIHQRISTYEDPFERDWSVWVCTSGNCVRLSPLVCIFCYSFLEPNRQLHRNCPMLYSRNHLHRMPGGGIHRSVRAWWLLMKDVLLYQHKTHTTPSFFFSRPVVLETELTHLLRRGTPSTLELMDHCQNRSTYRLSACALHTLVLYCYLLALFFQRINLPLLLHAFHRRPRSAQSLMWQTLRPRHRNQRQRSGLLLPRLQE